MKRFVKIVNGYYYFHNISFSCPLLYEKENDFVNTGLTSTPEVFIRCKKLWGPTQPGAKGREFLIYLFVDVFKQIGIFAAIGSFGLWKHSS